MHEEKISCSSPPPFPPPPHVPSTLLTDLEAIEATLLFLFLLHGSHSLLQFLSRLLGCASLVSFLLDGLHAVSRAAPLLPEFLELVFVSPALLLPSFHVQLCLVALRFEIHEGFLEGGGELLFGEEVLLHLPDVGVFFFELGGVGGEEFGVLVVWWRWEGGAGEVRGGWGCD